MKLFLLSIIFTINFPSFANETVAPCQGDICSEDKIVFESNKNSQKFTDEELDQSFDTTEQTLKNISRDIAGEIETE